VLIEQSVQKLIGPIIGNVKEFVNSKMNEPLVLCCFEYTHRCADAASRFLPHETAQVFDENLINESSASGATRSLKRTITITNTIHVRS